MNNTTTATVRTTVNGTVLAIIVVVISKLTNWQVQIEDLAPYLPIFAAVLAIFYRLSRAVTDKWPVVGYVLFGKVATPKYVPPVDPPPPAAE